MNTSRTTKDRWFYLILVPLGWAACSLLHFRYPGDEYAMYFISSMAGSWIVSILRPELQNPLLPVSVAAAGALVLALAGGLLSWLRVRKALWTGLFAASGERL